MKSVLERDCISYIQERDLSYLDISEQQFKREVKKDQRKKKTKAEIDEDYCERPPQKKVKRDAEYKENKKETKPVNQNLPFHTKEEYRTYLMDNLKKDDFEEFFEDVEKFIKGEINRDNFIIATMKHKFING